jgi:hypothetical protein
LINGVDFGRPYSLLVSPTENACLLPYPRLRRPRHSNAYNATPSRCELSRFTGLPALNLAAAVTGLATLADFLLGWELKLDEFSVRHHAATAYSPFRGPLAHCGAATFAVLRFARFTPSRQVLRDMAALAGVEIEILAGFSIALSLVEADCPAARQVAGVVGQC